MTHPLVPIREWIACRICGGRLHTVLNLGSLHVSAFPAVGESDSLAAPLDWCRCVDCGLVQLRHSVDPEHLYCTYWYRSGVNETMIAELRSIVEAVLPELQPGDTVIDIGANDGTLLAAYPDTVQKVAYEPAENLQEPLRRVADLVTSTTFPSNGIQSPAAKVITSIACYYDTDDPVGFAHAVKACLHPQGVWVVQFQDLDQMLRATAFDNICHEHLWYPSLAAIEAIATHARLQVWKVEQRAINGGSLRVYLQHPGARPVDPSVAVQRHAEKGCESAVTLERFAHTVRQRISQIAGTVAAIRARGQTIDLYAASTKANTLLQSCGLNRSVIRQAWERTPEKVGRRTVGTGIPIVAEADGRRDPPDVLLLGAWQFRDAFVRREREFLRSGRTMVAPLPVVETIWEGR